MVFVPDLMGSVVCVCVWFCGVWRMGGGGGGGVGKVE